MSTEIKFGKENIDSIRERLQNEDTTCLEQTFRPIEVNTISSDVTITESSRKKCAQTLVNLFDRE